MRSCPSVTGTSFKNHGSGLSSGVPTSHGPRLPPGPVVHLVARLAHRFALTCAVAAGCAPMADGPTGADSPRLPPAALATADAPFEPIPRSLPLDPAQVALGRRLFEDPRLSGGGDTACVDCHDLGDGGIVPGEARSNHPMTASGPYNVPTVFNVGFNYRYNWQARFDNLEDQLAGPMMSDRVMAAGSWAALQARLAPAYDGDFVQAGFDQGVDEEAIRVVLSAFQRSLYTPDAPFDRFLRGELELEADQARGYALFREIGCASCHQGINIGGNMVQRFGVLEDAFDRPLTEADQGRMAITGDEADRHVFRVPSLRNVEVTAPYFHDGSAATLGEAVQHMARVQLGYDLDSDELADIVAFLRTLTGTWEGFSLAPDGPT